MIYDFVMNKLNISKTMLKILESDFGKLKIWKLSLILATLNFLG